MTINSVQPGPIATDMNPSEGKTAEMLKTHITVARFGTVEAVAGMVAYLAGRGEIF